MAKSIHLTPEVIDVLTRSTIEHNTLTLPAGQLEKALYAKVDKVLKALGGKWDRRVGGHVFASGAPADLTEVLAAGKVVDRKKTLEQFYTPMSLAQRMARTAVEAVARRGPRPLSILDPSAGTGNLLAALAEQLDDNAGPIIALDIDPISCDALRAQAIATEVFEGDFLQRQPWHSQWQFDIILMNPPFSGNKDIRHVLTALDMLAPGGVLVALTSMHWTFASEHEAHDFRALLGIPKGQWRSGFSVPHSEHGIKMVTIDEIPAGTFGESGTMVATVMLVIEK